MDTIAIVLIGIGAFLIYEAVKNPAPTPIKTAVATIPASSSSTGSS